MKESEKLALDIPEPNIDVVEGYAQLWDANDATHQLYVAHNETLKQVWGFLPENTNFQHILIKVTLLNSFYSTRIANMSLVHVAKAIHDLKIDDKLAKSEVDTELVNAIADATKEESGKRAYSFATKYCHWHRPDLYPIYDSFVGDGLWYFFKKYGKMQKFLKTKDLADYSSFYDVMANFREVYGLAECTIKEVDLYLWRLGKEYFKSNKDEE
ncbi:hypothetical protein [Entomospira culicis]|uniref:Uncharacterized protein n=1 Tax=Entomospira culicis TaxID=2719989 RepID=A0A968GFY1_9SPIO|nr:hypothetical protein [Entomospira culicis]NIZ19637.1 hypothetical protein [Entomospira culicis]NIZ69851.1 hypothetical protein [Entomospira culicis]WDI36958.1 hypothetical protein PVA46_06455 [Entomospira culicis]WDI38587.1 hypothetical protein PVA47_06465 [Entomospira culicis]